MCNPSYSVNGHWGTQLKLGILNEATGKVQTEWAYAPYIIAKNSLGPKVSTHLLVSPLLVYVLM
jgi:hypothetical protein